MAKQPSLKDQLVEKDGKLYFKGLSVDEIHDRLEASAKSSKSLYYFAQQAWVEIEGARKFADGWYLEAIAEHVQAVAEGQIKRLLINQPPRSWKSGLLGVAFVPWLWINRPHERWVFASHDESLTTRDSLRCRSLILSKWYQLRWGSRFKLSEDMNRKDYFTNDKFGGRISLSTKGGVTGEGGEGLIVDDPNDASDQYSDKALEQVQLWWDTVMPTRLNDPKTARRIVCQQRISEKDLSGHIISRDEGEWVKLILPLEFEMRRRCFTVKLPSTGDQVWRDPRTKPGESLCKERWGVEEIAQIKKDLRSEYAIAGQLQQRPAPAAGGMIKKAWFQWWKSAEPPKFEFIIQSWDTALSEREEAAYSACMTLGIFRDEKNMPNALLLSVWRGRVEYPELRDRVKRLAFDYLDDGPAPLIRRLERRPDMILIEHKASGISLIQDLMRSGVPGLMKFDPTKHGDKVGRVRLITPLLENGRVWVPAQPPNYTFLRPWADEVVENCAMFPKAETRDIVDTLTQALLRLSISGWVHHSLDPVSSPDPNLIDRAAARFDGRSLY